MKTFLAEYDTPKHIFQSIGDTQERAEQGIINGWAKYCEDTGEELTGLMLDEIQVFILEEGSCYLDRNKIYPSPIKTSKDDTQKTNGDLVVDMCAMKFFNSKDWEFQLAASLPEGFREALAREINDKMMQFATHTAIELLRKETMNPETVAYVGTAIMMLPVIGIIFLAAWLYNKRRKQK